MFKQSYFNLLESILKTIQEKISFGLSMENKIYSSSSYEEASFKQKGDLDIFLSFVIIFLIRCIFLNMNFCTLNFSGKQKIATPLGTILSTDEKIVAQADVKILGSTVESLIV